MGDPGSHSAGDIAFLRFKPELLYSGDVTSDANAWPTPRSWEMASRVLTGVAQRQRASFLNGAGEFEAVLLDGTVGQAAASELVAFLRLFRELPSIDEILLNPATAKVPTEPSAQIAIATALGRVLTDTSVGRDGLPRTNAHGDARDGDAGRGGARHRHYAHAGFRALWG